MNPEIISDLSSEQADLPSSGAEIVELAKPESASEAYPYYIVPRPPVPGKTAWSVVPW
ncbi:hypothetical protein [Methylococcus sp. EFPC2]|uniref:hypothetical protein n=1 Tax=Methylococcus sp. EFPC2 TaxID=2812648 RepID=UPI0019687C81|nr:hypothetical protein [Methylococcus sp. EFPC2]QSA95986.1 hypothetical protein JWZ97_12140 [Methylococcus sp. EFPC2]